MSSTPSLVEKVTFFEKVLVLVQISKIDLFRGKKTIFIFSIFTQFLSKKLKNQRKKTEFSQKSLKNVWKGKKSTEKRQIRGTPSGSRPAFACRPALRSRLYLEKTLLFFVHFRTVFVDFRREITEKGKNWTKKLENGWKKRFRPAFRCAQHLKAGRNTQHPSLLFLKQLMH